MKIINVFAIMFCWVGILTSCSNEDFKVPVITPAPEKPETSFSLLSPDGELLVDGQEALAKEFVFDTEDENHAPIQSSGLKMEAWVRNNTDAPLRLTVSWKVLESDYSDVENLFTYCWTVCYNKPAPEKSDVLELKANEVFKNFYGTVEDLRVATSSFEVKLEYTITNVDTDEAQKVIGHYIYKKQ